MSEGENKRSVNAGQCKCCLQNSGTKNLWEEHNYNEEFVSYGEMLRNCFVLTWNSPADSSIVEYICESCTCCLEEAMRFKKLLLNSEKTLLGFIEEAKNDFKQEIDNCDADLDTEYSPDYEYNQDEKTKEKIFAEINLKVEPLKSSEKRSTKTKQFKNYTSDDLKMCMDAVKTKNLSQVKASLLYNVPVKIIRKELKKRVIKKEREEKKPKIKVKGKELAKHSHNIGIILCNTNATPIRCRNDIGYACCFCDAAYPDPAELKTHTIMSHDSDTKRKFAKGKRLWEFLVKLDITGLKCELCNVKYNSIEDIMDHLPSHKLNLHMDLDNHILPFKFDGDDLRCVLCQATFNKFKGLLEHMSRHYRNYICDECDVGFVSKCILMLHKEGHKTGAFACSFCTKICDTLRKKKSHERAVHIHSQLISKCGYCGEKFSTYRKKQKHISSVHGVDIGEVKCNACDRGFVTQSALRIHTRRDHLMERRFSCKLCDMKFFASRELTSHMVKHTGVRAFQCEVCMKAFGTKKTLREHLRIHANDRRFKCEHCSQAFVQNCSLKGHLRSKHGLSI